MQPAATTNTTHRMIIIVVLTVCGSINLYFAVLAVATHPALNSDFLAFWSFPRFAKSHGISGIYDAARLSAFQQALYPGFHSFYPLLYPPMFLLPIWWLSDCGFATAQTIWTLAGLAAITSACWGFFRPPFRWFAIIAILASPASLLNGATGETAYFTTALLIGGFALLPVRPLLAGILFGLLTLKPQLGVLVPFALLARGEWRAIAAAAATGLALIGLSCAVFPPGLWLAWAHSLPVYQAQYFAARHALNLNIIVTVTSNLIVLGVSPHIAWLVQYFAAAGIAGVTYAAFRFAPYRLAVAVLFSGIFLAVPHAYAYDSLIIIAALMLIAEAALIPAAAGVLALLVYLAPLMLLTPARSYFLYAGPEILLFIVICRLAFATASDESCRHEPDTCRRPLF